MIHNFELHLFWSDQQNQDSCNLVMYLFANTHGSLMDMLYLVVNLINIKISKCKIHNGLLEGRSLSVFQRLFKDFGQIFIPQGNGCPR